MRMTPRMIGAPPGTRAEANVSGHPAGTMTHWYTAQRRAAEIHEAGRNRDPLFGDGAVGKQLIVLFGDRDDGVARVRGTCGRARNTVPINTSFQPMPPKAKVGRRGSMATPAS